MDFMISTDRNAFEAWEKNSLKSIKDKKKFKTSAEQTNN